MMDIKSFTNWGDQGGRQVALSVQKNGKNHKNSTYTKIKFYIIFIFFLRWILKILHMEGPGG